MNNSKPIYAYYPLVLTLVHSCRPNFYFLQIYSRREVLMLLFDLTQEWLSYLPQTFVQAYSQQPQQRQQQQQRVGFELGCTDSQSMSHSARPNRRGSSFNVKRQTSNSWTERSESNPAEEQSDMKSSTPPVCASSTASLDPGEIGPDRDRSSQPSYGSFKALTSSTPNLLQLDASQASSGKFTVAVRVQDLRHSKRGRAIRSTSVPYTTASEESEQAFADRIEMLASKLLHVVRRYKQVNFLTIASSDLLQLSPCVLRCCNIHCGICLNHRKS